MLPENKYAQYGFPRENSIQGITIHETGNVDMNAQQLFEYLRDVNKTSQGVHYICDDQETIQVMPDDWSVWHTGKGLDWGNRYTIAIEVCSSLSDEKYRAAQDRANGLIHELQERYSITDDFIFFHNTFNERVYCPKTLLDMYGSVKAFVMNEL